MLSNIFELQHHKGNQIKNEKEIAMKKTWKSRAGSGLLASLLITSTIASPLTVLAGDTLPYLGDSAKGRNQPYQHGYRAEDLLDWSPKTDPHAELLRARVPLQNRNEAFADTQAYPSLNPEMEYFTLTGDYGNAFFDSYPYTNEFSQHLFNFWQYTDYYASWHGMPTEEVPESLYDAEGERNGTSDWQKRNFEFGMMNLPNPAYTNAAHKNGALSLGCIFQPRAYQHYDILLTRDQDGNFPYAEKLIEICEYYGFDGWFFNMEGRSISAENSELLGQFFNQMREAGLYIQWYTASSSFNSSTAKFLTSAKQGETTKEGDRAQSVFLDYGWTGSAQSSANTAANFGLNPLKAVFGGVEAGRDRWGCDTRYFDRTQSSGNSIVSIASLGTDFVQTGLDEDMGGGMRREQDEYQWMAFERERLWWTGGNSVSAPNAGLSGADIGTTKTGFKGVSNYITERSVINGDTFVTDFNTGHGLSYFKDGQISNEKEWSNINLQDILPTWQWWFETTGESGLNAEFDYGTQYKKSLKDGTESAFGFKTVGAYNGGSSLSVYGDVSGETFMHLYKTDLEISDNSSMDLTFLKTSDDEAAMDLGVIFEDDTDTLIKLPIENSAAKSDGWVTSRVDFGSYAGKKIAAFGLVFDGNTTGYQMNIGQIQYISGDAQKPAAPTGVKIEKAYDTGEVVLSWDMASYDDVKRYNIYKLEGEEEIFLGGVYDSSFYIKDIYGIDNAVQIVIKAVSADGTESDGTIISHNYENAVKNIAVTAEDGALNVTWEGGQADITVTTSSEDTPRIWTGSGDGSARIIVPGGKDADGARYTMELTRNGITTAYDGRLDDSYSVPYDGSMKGHAFTNPLSKDWRKLHYEYTTTASAAPVTGSYTRGTGSGTTNDWADFKSLPSNIATLKVILEDYSGNMSQPVNYLFEDGEPFDPEKEISADEFPDEALREAIKEKIGPTIGDVTSYEGALDLSDTDVKDLTGLGLITGITKLDISGTGVSDVSPVKSLKKLETLIAKDTEIESIKKDTLSVSLVSLELSDNGRLVAIEEGAISALVNLESLRIQNCPALKTLYLTGTTLKEIDLTGSTALTHFYGNNSQLDTILYGNPADFKEIEMFDISGSKFDLLDGTSERVLLDALTGASGASAVNFGSQKPEAYIGTMPESVVIQQNSEKFRVMDYFDKLYKEAKTVRGNLFAELEGKDWIASDYVIADKITPPGKVYVEILDSEGNVINKPEDTGEPAVDTDTNVALNNATVLGGTGQNSGETYAMLFDGKTSTKWCTNGNSGWTAFYLGEAVTVGNWKTTHAEVNNEPSSFNTEDFELQVLNTDAVSTDEEAFIASKPGSAILGNDNNWTTISHITGNTQMVVDTDVEDAPEARVYRLKVNKSINGGQYAAIRIHELELYAADAAARDYDGIFEPDTAGTYQANFMKGKKLLNTLTIEVQEEEAKELRIITEPEDFVGSIEETAAFAVEAEGTGLTYQWQYCNADSNIWRTSSMAGNDTMEIRVPVTKLRDGQKYRCVVTDADHNTVISKVAALKVGTADGAPIIAEQPADYTGAVGEMAVFVVKTEGTNLSYQWQYCNADSNIWRVSSMEGNQTDTLNVQVANFRNGQKYRCVVTSDNGRIAISEVAVVSVTE